MPQSRLFKQIIYSFILISLILLIGFGLFSIFKPTEPIQTSTASPVKPLIVENSYLISQGVLDYDVLVTVRNPNVDYGASEFEYELKFSDTQGSPVKTIKEKSYILPGQRKYLIFSAFRSQNEVSNVRVEINQVVWSKLKSFVEPSALFFVKQQNLRKEGNLFILDAVISNISNFDFDTVNIVVRLDGSGVDPVAVGVRREDTFISKTDRSARFVWTKDFSQSITGITVETYTNVFKNDNFLRDKGGEIEKFQQFF